MIVFTSKMSSRLSEVFHTTSEHLVAKQYDVMILFFIKEPSEVIFVNLHSCTGSRSVYHDANVTLKLNMCICVSCLWSVSCISYYIAFFLTKGSSLCPNITGTSMLWLEATCLWPAAYTLHRIWKDLALRCSLVMVILKSRLMKTFVKSLFVKEMAWHRKVPSHFLNKWWYISTDFLHLCGWS